jgi:hypothetical protein
MGKSKEQPIEQEPATDADGDHKKKKAPSDRSNVVHVARVLKRHKTVIRGDVTDDLERVVEFVTMRIARTVATNSRLYAKSIDTIKPRAVHAALELLLHGELREQTLDFASDVLGEFQKAKRGEAEGTEAEGEVAEAVSVV